MQPRAVLEGLGYTRDEAEAYLAALELGESHVSDIAKRLRRPLSSVQAVMEKLHKDGLVNFYVLKRYKYWAAESPERLVTRLRERIDSVQAVIPQLKDLQRRHAEKPRVRIFEGVDEIRLIYDDMLAEQRHILGVIPWDEWIELLGRRFMDGFIERRMQHSLRIRLLTPRTAVAEELHARDAREDRETRFLPETMPTRITMLIYGTKVAFASLNATLPTAVIIDDPDMCETFTTFFEGVWVQSSTQ